MYIPLLKIHKPLKKPKVDELEIILVEQTPGIKCMCYSVAFFTILIMIQVISIVANH